MPRLEWLRQLQSLQQRPPHQADIICPSTSADGSATCYLPLCLEHGDILQHLAMDKNFFQYTQSLIGEVVPYSAELLKKRTVAMVLNRSKFLKAAEKKNKSHVSTPGKLSRSFNHSTRFQDKSVKSIPLSQCVSANNTHFWGWPLKHLSIQLLLWC